MEAFSINNGVSNNKKNFPANQIMPCNHENFLYSGFSRVQGPPGLIAPCMVLTLNGNSYHGARA